DGKDERAHGDAHASDTRRASGKTRTHDHLQRIHRSISSAVCAVPTHASIPSVTRLPTQSLSDSLNSPRISSLRLAIAVGSVMFIRFRAPSGFGSGRNEKAASVALRPQPAMTRAAQARARARAIIVWGLFGLVSRRMLRF